MVTSCSNALDEPRLFDVDAPNEDQCGLFDVGTPCYDQCGAFDAPDDYQCAPNESLVASPEAFELADPVRLVDITRRYHSRYRLEYTMHLRVDQTLLSPALC